MIRMQIKFSDKFLESEIKSLENVNVRVGILDVTKRARVARPKSAGFKAVGSTGRQGRKIRGQSKDLTMGELALILDDRYGVFTDAVKRGDNRDLNLITKELIKAFKGDPINERRIENAAIAFIRNPIMRGDFGGNSDATIKNKGFDWPMVDTGAFFTSINARLSR